jgi:hypothetical protein
VEASQQPPGASSDANANPANAPITNASGMIYAQGWDDIKLVANYAKTTFDSTGHIITSRNACGKDGATVLDLATWNKIAQVVNDSLTAEPGAEYCMPIPDRQWPDRFKFDGTATVTTSSGPRIVLEAKRGEVCTNVADHAKAADLMLTIDKIVDYADKAQCPNGWGS